ncbi:MAG: NfeD family protein [Flammeovirgaceae bacterium]
MEFIFIPGTTVVGFVGLACAALGIYWAYEKFGVIAGTSVLSVSMLVTLGGLYYGLKSGMWEKLSLKNKITSKVNEDQLLPIVGEEGKTISALRPSGTGEFNDQLYEVLTFGGLVDAGKKIRVIKVEGRKIWVEALPDELQEG